MLSILPYSEKPKDTPKDPVFTVNMFYAVTFKGFCLPVRILGLVSILCNTPALQTF